MEGLGIDNIKGEVDMEETIYISPDDIEIINANEYSGDLVECFGEVPEVAKPLLKGAKASFKKIEQMLYSAPAFINLIRAAIPKESFQAILSDEQKAQLAKGALKLMTKKDGSLMANLVDPNTNKIVSTIPLKSVKLTPEISQAMTSYATQMQMAQIAEEIQCVQIAVEEVRKGQEFDRLATAYSCQQKLLQAMEIKKPELKELALMRIASDAEDSRNLLMLSQNANLDFIKNQPESFFGKLISGAKPEKVNTRMEEIRESLCAVNMVSLVGAMAYQEMGEEAAARKSIEYYGDYIQKAYLSTEGLVQRLDMVDPSPKNYWSQTLPEIKKKIEALPCYQEPELIGEDEEDGE